MQDQPRSPDSATADVVWWGRLAVWVGAVILLTQSVTGRGIGVMTVAAVIAMSAGLLAFLGGLIWPSLSTRASIAGTEAPPPSTEPETGSEEPAGLSGQTAPAPGVETTPEPEPVSAPPQQAAVAAPERIETIEVLDGEPALGEACVRCDSQLQLGDLAAACPRCGSLHHAACWTANRFHCATPGCSGSGSLEAPRTAV